MEHSELDAIGLEFAKYIESRIEGGRYVIIFAEKDSEDTYIMTKIDAENLCRFLRDIADGIETGKAPREWLPFRDEPRNEHGR